MGRIGDLLADPSFGRRLSTTRGASEARVHRIGDDDVDPAALRCFADLEKAAGMTLGRGDALCTSGRTTLTACFGVPGVAADVVVSWDSGCPGFACHLVHSDLVKVDLGGVSGVLSARAHPDGLIDHHFTAPEARAVRKALERMELTVAPPTGTEPAYDAVAIALRERTAEPSA